MKIRWDTLSFYRLTFNTLKWYDFDIYDAIIHELEQAMTCLQKIIDLKEKTMLKFDTLKNDYPSRRSVIYGRKGMVCTSQRWRHRRGLIS